MKISKKCGLFAPLLALTLLIGHKTYSTTYDSVVTKNATNNVAPQCTPVTIFASPGGGSGCLGGSFTFNVTPQGTGPFTYRWFKDTTLMSSTTNSLTIFPMTISDTGNYWVMVSNACGSANSTIARLGFFRPAVITSNLQPTYDHCRGSNATLQVLASGNNLQYNWQKNGQTIGVSTPFLNLTNFTVADSGNYTCLVFNQCNMITSRVCKVKIYNTPRIIMPTTRRAYCTGSRVVFKPQFLNYKNNRVEWVRNGNIVALSDSLVFNVLSPNDAGKYLINMFSPCGIIISDTLSLSVQDSIKFTQLPQDLNLCEGDAFTLSTQTNVMPSTQLWYRGNTLVQAASFYSVSSARLTNTGKYTTTVTNDCGLFTSDTIKVTVNQVYSNTVTDTIYQGQTYTFGSLQITQPGSYRQTFRSAANCDSVVSLNLTVLVSQPKTHKIRQIGFQPNPAQNQIVLTDSPADCQLEILDLTGKVVGLWYFSNQDSQRLVNISALQTGVYYVRLKSGIEYYLPIRLVKN